MKFLLALAVLLSASALSAAAAPPTAADASPEPQIKPVKVVGGYAVVVSKATAADAEWARVVAALQKKYDARVIVYSDSVGQARAELARQLPRYACFVARPEEASREFVIQVHRLTRRLDDDPYTGVIWGILTGYDAADALRIAARSEPLVIRRAAAGTGIPLELFDEGVWYSEGEKGVYEQKGASGKIERKTGPADSTRELVDALNNFHPDLFFTSGHATEHDWQLGYSYRNGQFRCRDGVLRGIDLDRHAIAIDSPNPKVYLPLGNCLMGHIADRQSMALAFMHSGGVHQMCGYVVSTWYGYGGWGIKDYFFGQPGRFTLAEAFYANQQALVHELESRFPDSARTDLDQFNIETDPGVLDRIAQKLGYKQWNDHVKDNVGLLWDRDTVAFYGDPAWEARLAPHEQPWDQSLTEQDGTFTFRVTAKQDVAWGRPPLALLPHRVASPTIVSGQEFKPTVSGLFVMLSAPAKLEKGKTYTVVFKSK